MPLRLDQPSKRRKLLKATENPGRGTGDDETAIDARFVLEAADLDDGELDEIDGDDRSDEEEDDDAQGGVEGQEDDEEGSEEYDGEEDDEEGDEELDDGEELGVIAAGTSSTRKKQAALGDSTDMAENEDDDDEEGEEEEEEQEQDDTSGKRSKKMKALTPEELEAFQAKLERTGVVYISRVPPYMKPLKIKHLLSPIGEIGRIYLQAEDSRIREKRKRLSGNSRKNFTEGWVEFMDKNKAKKAVLLLNNSIIGGKKGNFYHDDIWNLKYLPKFKWNQLTERIAYEKAVRDQRIRAETSQARREMQFYVKNVEQAKMIKNMEDKRKSKSEAPQEKAVRRQFAQRKPITQSSSSAAPAPDASKSKSDKSALFQKLLG